jgi:hypothetical protein
MVKLKTAVSPRRLICFGFIIFENYKLESEKQKGKRVFVSLISLSLKKNLPAKDAKQTKRKELSLNLFSRLSRANLLKSN